MVLQTSNLTIKHLTSYLTKQRTNHLPVQQKSNCDSKFVKILPTFTKPECTLARSKEVTLATVLCQLNPFHTLKSL